MACAGAPAAGPNPASRIEADVAYLASPALAGRGAGTSGGAAAARFLAQRHAELGLRGAFAPRCPSAPPCPPAFAQQFRVETGGASNIAAVLLGADSLLRGTWIVIGAHFDHVGTSAERAADPERGWAVRPGADDNASGTAAVLELARRLSQRPRARSVLFVHFDAEEMGLLGSQEFVHEPPIPMDSLVVMINLDMVGRLRDQPLTVDVARTGLAFRGLLDTLATEAGLRLQFTSAFSSRSDHAPFAEVMVPAFAFFTGLHSDYHRTTDIAAKVDAAGILRIVDLVERLVRIAGPRL